MRSCWTTHEGTGTDDLLRHGASRGCGFAKCARIAIAPRFQKQLSSRARQLLGDGPIEAGVTMLFEGKIAAKAIQLRNRPSAAGFLDLKPRATS